ncbi:unnamed protein product [Schistosoma margrebowiei]|uniref:ERAP1-like C-terminal domain-containing protein n=1 Tax=Schistosoma margrebowiei TaxID=48269 RepID=A0A3P8F737_9TREM|nr:unnamed protein product [Schistosoma margrebowiei]
MNDLFSLANILPDLRSIVYCTAIRHGGQEEWKFLESQLMLNDPANEEDSANKMMALLCSRDTEIMKRDFTESILNALTKYPYSLFSGRNYEKVSEEPVYFPSLYKCYFVSSHIPRFNFPNVII